MKAAYIGRHGGPDTLIVGERPQPQCGPYDLLVEVKAASINPVDWKIRDGLLKIMIAYKMPLTLGQDLSGVVVRVGSKVARFKPGDEIFARLDKASIGSFAQFAAVRESDAAMKPTNLTHIEAASIPLVGLTAWQVMRDHVGLKPGQLALIHAGSGGVGTFAIQLAKVLGARVATTVSAKNVPLVKRLGADMVVDYTSQRFEDAVTDCDFVFDTQGGETLLRSIDATRRGGRVITIAGIPTPRVMQEWGLSWWKQWLAAFLTRKARARAAARGVTFDYHFMSPSGQQLAAIAKLMEDKKIVPVIDKVFTLDEARDAFAHAEAGHAVGKVIITP
jgi:alcohol dehydrogenase